MGHTNNVSQFTKIPISNSIGIINNVECGFDHTIIINSKNEIFGCGKNGNGNLGLGHNEPKQATFIKMVNPIDQQ